MHISLFCSCCYLILSFTIAQECKTISFVLTVHDFSNFWCAPNVRKENNCKCYWVWLNCVSFWHDARLIIQRGAQSHCPPKETMTSCWSCEINTTWSGVTRWVRSSIAFGSKVGVLTIKVFIDSKRNQLIK